MARLIKRYGSRKLYDTSESRYILLEDIAEYVRNGEDITVIDNKSQEDVTCQTLTQVISEEGRKKENFLSSDLLHDLIRAGETAVTSRVRQIQDGMDRFVKKSFDKIVPLRSVRDEMQHLRDRLEELESAISRTETAQATVTSETPESTDETSAQSTELVEPEGTAKVEKVAKPTARKTTRKTTKTTKESNASDSE